MILNTPKSRSNRSKLMEYANASTRRYGITGVLSDYNRKKVYDSIDALQADLDEWIDFYNNKRTHQGKVCCGRTPMETLEDGKKVWAEKFVA